MYVRRVCSVWYRSSASSSHRSLLLGIIPVRIHKNRIRNSTFTSVRNFGNNWKQRVYQLKARCSALIRPVNSNEKGFRHPISAPFGLLHHVRMFIFPLFLVIVTHQVSSHIHLSVLPVVSCRQCNLDLPIVFFLYSFIVPHRYSYLYNNRITFYLPRCGRTSSTFHMITPVLC